MVPFTVLVELEDDTTLRMNEHPNLVIQFRRLKCVWVSISELRYVSCETNGHVIGVCLYRGSKHTGGLPSVLYCIYI